MTAPRAWCSVFPGGIRLAVQVAANAKKTEIIGIAEGMLKIRLQAQPVDGKANQALTRFIAAQLGVAKNAVTVSHGLANKRKLVTIDGCTLSVDEICQRLLVETS